MRGGWDSGFCLSNVVALHVRVGFPGRYMVMIIGVIQSVTTIMIM